MSLFLPERNSTLTELMDDPDCDEFHLNNTYRHFAKINRAFSGWKSIFYRYILPECRKEKRQYTLLDIGFGGGDIPLHLDRLAKKHRIDLQVTGIETDERSLRYVSELHIPASIRFRHQTLNDVVKAGKHYDFVISNHVLHHLTEPEIVKLCQQSAKLAQKKVLFNDLRRSGLAWFLFNALTVIGFNKSFIRTDGLISIRKSFTQIELQKLAPAPFQVRNVAPFRLLLYLDKTKA